MSNTFWRGFRNFFGSQGNATSTSEKTSSDGIRPLEDADYEFLFSQLLEGVAHGWQQQRVRRFFEQLGEQGSHILWVDWLNRYGPRVLASPDPQPKLAENLVLLAHQTQNIPKIMKIGAICNAIAQQLQAKAPSNPIWEYDSVDANLPTAPEVPPSEQQQIVLSVEEFVDRLQQDENFARQVAQQLGLDTIEPQLILQRLQEQAQAE